MKRIIFGYILMVSLCVTTANAAGLEDLEAGKPAAIRYPHASYGVNNDFGRAFSLVALLALSKELTQAFTEDKTQVVKAIFVVASCTFLVDFSLMWVRALSNHGPKWCSFLWYRLQAWLSTRMGLPPAFDPNQLRIWEQIVEQTMLSLCKKAHSSDISFERSGQQDISTVQWEYYREHIGQLVIYIAHYYTGHEQYYRARRQRAKQQDLGMLGYAGNDADHICFMIKMIVADLLHINQLVQKAQTQKVLDITHLSSMSAGVLTLMKQLRCMINGEQIETDEHISAFAPLQFDVPYRQ